MKKITCRITKVVLMTCIAVLSSAVVNETMGACTRGGITPATQSICSGTAPATMTATPPSGSSPTYQWYYKVGIQTCPAAASGVGTWLIIAGATSSTYTPGVQAASITYACQTASSNGGACGLDWQTNCCQVTVTTTPAAVTVSPASGSFCGSVTLTASGGPPGTMYWLGNSSAYSFANQTTSQLVNIVGNDTYYFRLYNPAGPGCWGPAGSASVTIFPSMAPPPLDTVYALDYNGNYLNEFSNNVTICQNQQIEFNVANTFGEQSEFKMFKWKVNGVTQFTQTGYSYFPPAITYITNTIANGDVVTLTIVWTPPPSATCYSPDSVTSTPIVFAVTAN
ncbi:MAG: hypothetical protein JJE25_05205, partial [Bacteroidia bacterium]|nr:hypothetical protein [Bacteroidia bacterium]